MPNAKNADPKIMQLLSRVDPGNQHAVPWMWGTTGIMYNVDKIKAIMPTAPTASLDMVFKKEVAAKFATCGIGLIDSWGDIMPMVARYLGQRCFVCGSRRARRRCGEAQGNKSLYAAHLHRGYYQQLAEGDLCLAIGYSGDALIARRMVGESHGTIQIDYSFAREMVPFYIDSMVIPADSPNPTGALGIHRLRNAPEISASVTRFIGFATANAAAMPLLEPSVTGQHRDLSARDGPRRLELQKVYSPEETRDIQPAWIEFKSGQ